MERRGDGYEGPICGETTGWGVVKPKCRVWKPDLRLRVKRPVGRDSNPDNPELAVNGMSGLEIRRPGWMGKTRVSGIAKPCP